MPARNDSKAVAAAARTVDRDAVASLLRDALTKRLPKTRTRRADPLSYAPDGRAAYPIGDPRSGFGEDGELRLPRSSAADAPYAGPTRKRRSRVDYATKQRVVELKPYGKWPRYGTARAAKTEAVRKLLKERQEAEVVTKVTHLLGLSYEWEGKYGTITFHDLEVMADKYLIVIKEGN